MLIDWFTIVAQIINFLILVWLLKRFLYKPILNVISERETKISEQLANAEKLQSDAKKEREVLENRTKELDDQRGTLIQQARDDAQSERERLFEEAKKSVEAFTKKSRTDFKHEEDQARESTTRKIEQEVFEITRKVLVSLSGAKLESQMVDMFIQRIGDLPKNKEHALMPTSPRSTRTGIVRSAFELSQSQRTAIENAICKYLGKETSFQFEIVPDLVSGIEFNLNGQKLAWSIDDYMTSMEKEVHKVKNPETLSP